MDLEKSYNYEKRRGYSGFFLLFSFLIPFVVIVLALIALHIVPFGDKHSLAITDAKYYLNGQMNLARLMRGEENWLYSLGNGLGGNQWSSLSWGSLAPASLLSLFATLETIPGWFTWISVVNLSLCGLTMYILLQGLNGPKLSHLIFSTSYALIGFNVVNSYQTLFFHGVQFLPLVVLGLVNLLRGKSPLLYILSLSACIFLNFYFGFHLCVISVLLLLVYLYLHWAELKNVKELVIRWAFASILAGLLASPMWMPALKAFSGGGRLDQTGLSEFTFFENMPFIQMFSKLFSGANSTNELVRGMPNIFCGILTVALVVLFFLDKRKGIRQKRAAAILLGVYLISFYIPAFTLLMHGGTHTNWFPYRYSYVFSFLLIMIAAEEYEQLNMFTFADLKYCGTILLIGVLLIFSTRYEFVTGGAVMLDFTLLLLMYLAFYLYKTKQHQTPQSTLSLFLLLVVCGNLYANYIISTKNVQEWELDLDKYNENIMVSGALTEALNTIEPGFFRMEKDKSESGSVAADPALYNYNGVSHSGPTERMFVHQGLCKLGINWYDMRHWYSEGIPAATDSLLGLKYLISERDLTEEKGYEKKIDLKGYKIFQDPYTLPVSILAEKSIQDIVLGENAFENLNSVWRGMTGGNRDIFIPQEDVSFSLFSDYSNQSVTSRELRESFSISEASKKANDSSVGSIDSPNTISVSNSNETQKDNAASYILYTFEAKQDGPVYMYDTSVPESPNGLPDTVMKYVGTYRAGDTVEGKIPLSAGISSGDLLRGYCVNLAFAYADNGVLADYAALLNARDITFNADHENDLRGEFTAEPNQRILFTLPWDEGWTCYIDGKPVPIDKTWNLFMSVEVPEGHHSWEMKFFPAWMNYGLYISGAALLGLVVYMIIWKKKQKTPQNITAPETEIVEVSE